MEGHANTGWFSTSARTNVNIDECAKGLVSAVLEHDDVFVDRQHRRKSGTGGRLESGRGNIRPARADSKQKKGGCC